MEVFYEGENYLEDGRKLIQPHTAVHQVSGYFFFYGYHYQAEYLRRMGDRAPVSRWERNAWTMIRTQEDDGCWWDTAAADYGDKWGTGFALMVLDRYLEHPLVEDDAGADEANTDSEGDAESADGSASTDGSAGTDASAGDGSSEEANPRREGSNSGSEEWRG